MPILGVGDVVVLPGLPPQRTVPPITEAERLCVSIRDACLMLGICKTLVYRYIDDGTLRTTKLGQRRVVWVSDIKRLAHGGE